MAGNLSWEDKVDSMLRQTGDNLERLKGQLHGQNVQSAWTQPPLLRDTKQAAVGVPPLYAASSSLPLTEGTYNMADRHHVVQGRLLALRNVAAVTRTEQLPREMTPQCSPLLVHDLTKRLSQQEMEIASLRSALAKMEETSGKHEGDICLLKRENSELRSRLADRGVHMTTESKFEQWRAQMTAEVQSLYAAVSTHRSIQQDRREDREGVAQLTHDLQKSKISTSGDIHWLSQELRATKTRLGQLEPQVASLQCSIAQLQSDAEECKSHRVRQRDCSQQINQIRRDLDRLDHHVTHCGRELLLRSKVGQAGSRRSDSGDEGGSEGQEGGVEEGLSFASGSTSSDEEGGASMTEDVSVLSVGSVEEDSRVELSLSANSDTPTLQLNSDSSSDHY